MARNIMMHTTGRKRKKNLPVKLYGTVFKLGTEHMIALKLINHLHHLNDTRSHILQSLKNTKVKYALQTNFNLAARQEWVKKDVDCRVLSSYAINFDDRVIVSYCLTRLCQSMFTSLNTIWIQYQSKICKESYTFYFYSRSPDTRGNAENDIRVLIDTHMSHCRFYCFAQEDGWLVYDGNVFVPFDEED